MVCCHWPQASSFSPGIVCGPAYGRDIIDRPARPCGFARICNLSGSLNRWSFRVSQVCQDATRDLSKLFRSFSSAVFHDRNETTGPRAWRAEKLSLSSINWGVRL